MFHRHGLALQVQERQFRNVPNLFGQRVQLVVRHPDVDGPGEVVGHPLHMVDAFPVDVVMGDGPFARAGVTGGQFKQHFGETTLSQVAAVGQVVPR